MAEYFKKVLDPLGGFTYYYKCEKCGNIYTRSTYGKHISTLCGTCSREHDYKKQLERNEQKKQQLINDVLDAIICDLLDYEETDLIPVKHFEDIVRQYYKKEGD